MKTETHLEKDSDGVFYTWECINTEFPDKSFCSARILPDHDGGRILFLNDGKEYFTIDFALIHILHRDLNKYFPDHPENIFDYER